MNSGWVMSRLSDFFKTGHSGWFVSSIALSAKSNLFHSAEWSDWRQLVWEWRCCRLLPIQHGICYFLIAVMNFTSMYMNELSASRHVEPKHITSSTTQSRLVLSTTSTSRVCWALLHDVHCKPHAHWHQDGWTPLNQWPSEHEMLTDSESEYEGTTMNLKENVQNMKYQANVHMRPWPKERQLVRNKENWYSRLKKCQAKWGKNEQINHGKSTPAGAWSHELSWQPWCPRLDALTVRQNNKKIIAMKTKSSSTIQQRHLHALLTVSSGWVWFWHSQSVHDEWCFQLGWGVSQWFCRRPQTMCQRWAWDRSEWFLGVRKAVCGPRKWSDWHQLVWEWRCCWLLPTQHGIFFLFRSHEFHINVHEWAQCIKARRAKTHNIKYHTVKIGVVYHEYLTGMLGSSTRCALQTTCTLAPGWMDPIESMAIWTWDAHR